MTCLIQLGCQIGQLLGVGCVVAHHVLHQSHQLLHGGVVAMAAAALTAVVVAMTVVVVMVAMVMIVMVAMTVVMAMFVIHK